MNLAPPVPSRISAEANRPATEVPDVKSLDNREASALLAETLASERRFKRAAQAAVRHGNVAAKRKAKSK